MAGVGAIGYRALEAKVFKMDVAVTEIARVSPAQAFITVTSTGYVVPQIVSKVGAKASGRIGQVLVKEGDTVQAGQKLAELEATDQRTTIAAASSRAAAAAERVEAARASLAEVEQQVERDRGLVKSGSIGRAALEDLEARMRSLEQNVKTAEAEARASQAEIAPLRVSLQDRTVISPIDGTVISKPIAVGEMVGPQVTIAEIADFRTLLVETDVPEARLYQVSSGTACEIVLDAYPARRYRGKVTEIGKRVDRAKATVKVKVEFVDAKEGVLPDMSARVSFLEQELSAQAVLEKPKTVVPASAVHQRDGRAFVFAVDNGAVRLVPIKLGPAFGSGFEMLDGPSPGTRVVAQPPKELTDGQRVREKGG